MNKRAIITYIGVGCLLAVLTVWSYLSTQRRMLEVAERTFVEAVHQDLDERWKKLGETVTIVSGKDKDVYTNLTIDRDSIKKSFALEDNNDSLNIDGDINQRMFHTILYEFDRKCNPETLNGIWQEKLAANGMDIATIASIHYDAADTDSLVSHYKPLSSYYAGISNEIRLSSFVCLSSGDVLFHRPYALCLGLAWLGWLVYVLWRIVPPRHSTKGYYQWAEGIVYDPASKCIYKHREQIKLFPKSNAVIKALVEAENHQLHGADLLTIAWGTDETNIDKLYTQNSIIRKDLKKLGSEFCLENIEGGYFKLVFPYASKAKER